VKRVLILAYHFPPIGGAGVQRAVKLVRYLPELGFEPLVVTGPGGSGDHWTPDDETLAAGLETVAVTRIDPPEPAAAQGSQLRQERWLMRPSAWSRWWVEGAVAAARRVGPVDVVLATMSPFESTVAAARIAAERGVPWVADLRDPWALDEMTVYPSALHRRVELRRMGDRLRGAAAVIMNTRESAQVVRSTFGDLPTVVAIPNGYDEDDFDRAPEPRTDASFRIVHTGYLHTDLGASERRKRSARRILGGSILGVDIFTRSHVYLIEAIDRIRAEDPELGARIEVHLAGVLTGADRVAADRPYVRARGYLTHADSVALMRSADLLFLPMHDLAPGLRARIVPGKTYENLGAARPILAAVPAGDAHDVLEASGVARICAPTDVVALADAIRGELRSPALAVADAGLLARYTRRSLSAEVAAVLDEVLAPAPRALATV
jgi:glycosyltransferase involved in cell wall biosynthesis